MSQIVGGSDPLSPLERLDKPVDRFSWDLNALRSLIRSHESRIKELEERLTHKSPGRPKKEVSE